jgi:ABC-2 type transport system ATP-binding protein
MNAALKIESLHKSFKTGFIPKKKTILKGISLSVNAGEIFGYLGPNGAGKTTTIKCILGLIFPDKGFIEVLGYPFLSLKAKEKLGFLPENPYFYDYLSASEFIYFYARLFGIKRTERQTKVRNLLHLVGLEKAAHIPLRKFSRGMLQRIGFSQALINDPDIVLLDEPLSGLDPIGRKEIRDIIVRLKEEGKTVFLSSHILQDIEMICDRVAILVEGKIINQGKITELISEKILFTEIIVSGIKPDDLAALGGNISTQGDRTLLKIYDEDRVERIFKLIQSSRGKIHSLIPRTQTLEDIFVGMVKKT